MSSSASPEDLEGAIQTILVSNFDADSKVCFVTLLKVIDNILQKPGNDKVRSLRTGNQAIKAKIMDRGGHHVLLACGFAFVRSGGGGEHGGPSRFRNEEKLVLKPSSEDTKLLVKARRTLARKAVHELGMNEDDLPVFKPPPVVATAPAAAAAAAAPSPAFDVYKGNRFDGQSAAAGRNLGAPENWKSKTERDLETLRQREAGLRREVAANSAATTTKPFSETKHAGKTRPFIIRQWTVFLPGQSNPPPSSRSAVPPAVAMANSTALRLDGSSNSSSNSSSSHKGDSKLLASHFQQQHAKRLASENRGFTTRAMRDLEKLKKTKVYSHTQLAIHFPDGVSVRANFSTNELLSDVARGLERDVLFSTETLALPGFELYQTPPRRVLSPPSATLNDLGLVPAARIYVGWNAVLRKLGTGNGLGAGWYIQPKLLRKPPPNGAPRTGPILPTSVAVDSTGTAKRKKTKAEKEAALMKRMLGKR